jgi:FAD/FMN-containing dehydrogenase
MPAFDGLRAACPTLTLLTAHADLDAASLDALRPTRGRPELAHERRLPLAVAEPASAGEVAALVRWAAGAHVPIVPRGGGSGLMGGAAVMAPAVVVDLRRLDAITVDAEACLVRAGAGATLASVDGALAPHDLMLGHDPWTAAVATVGGTLSTNGLGYLGARAGSMGAQVRAVEAVLPCGTVVQTRAAPTRSAGLDLTRLLVGSEGTLAIVTEATLIALPRPEERIVRGFELSAFGVAVRLAAALRRRGVRPVCLEAAAGDLPPAPASFLLVFDGLRGEAALHAERATRMVEAAGGTSIPAAAAEAQWRERHAIAERWAARRGSAAAADADGHQFDFAHVSVPLDEIDTVRAVAHAFVRRYGLRLVEEGLWHWPELYSLVVAGPAESAGGVRATIDAVCRAAQDAGGSMEYCHGVGWKLAHLAEREHGATALAVLRRLKAALDPAGILNPGKCGL